MARRHADYVYRNRGDSLRVRVFRRENGRWDYDVFHANGTITTYSEKAADDFHAKSAALAEAIYQHGPLRPIAVSGAITDKAWYAKQKVPKL